VATALAGKGPWRAAVDETSGRAFVLNRFDYTVSVRDVRRGRVVTTTYAYQPSALVVETAANRIIVAGGSQLTVLDATTGDLTTATTAACDQPLALDSQTALILPIWLPALWLPSGAERRDAEPHHDNGPH
jgi:DNA-binding beta-propeller fold protein YncE